ncbi:dipeptide epimerase [bacterium]|nr:dipeptide epimerase [bacterium]
MRIATARVYSMDIPLVEPYTIAYNTFWTTTNLFLVLESNDGLCGIGCAAPAPDVTDESPELALTSLRLLAEKLIGAHVETAFSSGSFAIADSPSANTAVDMALADLSARAKKQSLQQWLGSNSTQITPVTTSVTIGISSVEKTLERARKLALEGFTFLKIKGGHDAQLDISRLLALRNELDGSMQLALDANQGYSLKDVEALERHQEALSLLYLEQPTPKEDLSLLGEAAARTSIPVMADEAVQSADNTKRIGDLGTVRLINIKLQKMGGLAPAASIDQIAEDAGMRTMLGCMDESALSIAAALHFGEAHPNVQFYDLDGHFDLSRDPFDGLVLLSEGQLSARNGLGLGWNLLPPDFAAQ